MSSDELCSLSALALREGYQSKRFSPVEVTEAILARIERLNPALTAYITVTGDLAMAQARAAERALADGDDRPLTGIPISIKDLTPTNGVRTTRGSLIDPEWVPDFDAVFVERVLAAGAVMLGKTNTPEFGWKGDSGNRIVGPTHNPWRPGRTAGGSSGGAAAAVATGLGPLAQGSDGAGSIRIPAAFCGVFGLKPSFGLVPQYPPSAVGDLSHLGPITRTVRDAALLLDVVAGEHPRDRLSWSSGITYLAAIEAAPELPAGLRVAWSADLGSVPLEPAVREVVEAAAQRFTELGCIVEAVDPPADLPDPWDIVHPLWAAAMAGLHHEDLADVRDRLDPGRLSVIERARSLSASAVVAAQLARHRYYEGMRRFMEEWDLLLTPALPITAFAAGDDHPGTVAGRPVEYLSWTPFTYPFNLTGQPAASVPCGVVDGLPVGLQIVGRPHDDLGVLRAAAAVEAIAPWADTWPPIVTTAPV
jgi:aspartyl-tRNA(Asn)/glutamyl-tRNA(Gln) amidotransferase subunit A